MEYRRLGDAGIKLSVLSFGSWVTFGNQLDTEVALECMQAARDSGVNFFDNAEVYAGGESERIMGAALRELAWPRHSYLISTKFFWGIHDGPNTTDTLNRKYLLEAIEGSLERLGLDHVDIAYCHRADPDTPMLETVRAMSDMIDRAQAHYWGTSEWSADEIRAAYAVAEQHHLHAPVTEQPEYSMLNRHRVEVEYAPVYSEHGLGTTTFSPLASGLLTGKYLDGIPTDSRANVEGYDWLRDVVADASAAQKVRNLQPIATDLGCSLAQLALAWCTKNPHVSSVITGASQVSQVRENMAALDVAEALDEEIMARVEAAIA